MSPFGSMGAKNYFALIENNYKLLRLQSLFVKIDWVCHVCHYFYPGYTCRTTVILGTLKDDSL